MTTHRRVPVTTIARTVCDLARSDEFEEAVIALDAALRLRRTSLERVVDVVVSCYATPGSHQLSHLVAMANPQSESAYETVARLELSQLGHVAIPQVWAYDHRGPIGCGDLWLPCLWTYLEVDGDVKYGEAAPATRLSSRRSIARNAWSSPASDLQGWPPEMLATPACSTNESPTPVDEASSCVRPALPPAWSVHRQSGPLVGRLSHGRLHQAGPR